MDRKQVDTLLWISIIGNKLLDKRITAEEAQRDFERMRDNPNTSSYERQALDDAIALIPTWSVEGNKR